MKSFLGFFVPLFSVNLVWLAGEYPGFYGYDIFNLLDSLEKDHYNDWHSILYVFLVKTSQIVVNDVSPVGFLQILIFCLGVAGVLSFALTQGLSKRWVIPLFLYFLLNPMFPILNLYYNRDIPFSLLFTSFLIFFVLAFWDGRFRFQFHSWKVLGLCLLLALSARFRQETMVVLPLFVGLVFFYTKWKKKDYLKFAGGFGFVLFLVFFLPPQIVDISYPKTYRVTAFVNPLSNILSQEHHSKKQRRGPEDYRKSY